MIDIVRVDTDIRLLDSDVEKASNILKTQLGSLEYEPDLGIDLVFFLDERFQYQNESFLAYITEVLAQRSINVSQILEIVKPLYKELKISVSSTQSDTSLVV